LPNVWPNACCHIDEGNKDILSTWLQVGIFLKKKASFRLNPLRGHPTRYGAGFQKSVSAWDLAEKRKQLFETVPAEGKGARGRNPKGREGADATVVRARCPAGALFYRRSRKRTVGLGELAVPKPPPQNT